MKKTTLWTAIVCACIYTLCWVTDNNHVWAGLKECYLRGYKNAQVDDLQFKTVRRIPPSSAPRPWPKRSDFGSLELPSEVLDSTHAYKTTALAVVHHDTLLLDWSSERIPGADTMRTNSFSMAKTMTALAIGAAEQEGKLSVFDRVSKYLPRYAEGSNADLTIEHVLQMRSNIPFGENYKNPIGFMAKCTYGENMLDRLQGFEVQGQAGATWKYQGGNTLLLQEILLSVIDVSLGEWFAQKIWGPLGAEEEACWAIDNRGHERNYACFYSTASEYARLGQLLLDSGRVGDKQVLSQDFIARLMQPIGVIADGSDIQHYGYQVWMGEHKGHRFTHYSGLHGQYIVAVHDLDLVAVRTGFFRPIGKIRHVDRDVYSTIDMAIRVSNPL